ncbi:unnamed protein product [Symbiodinium natans]|uniref:WW domain-containing protein n=1 Tax=Symbiodinium natans TaxID=878477 RepID=A0A812KN12_9DINO|nr:unnamed protein product [Symbiodinium natans]
MLTALLEQRGPDADAPVVQELDVSCNMLTIDQFETLFVSMGVAGAKVIRYRMYGCSTLDDQVMLSLANFLSGQVAPEVAPWELHLSDCAITTEGFTSLMDAIETSDLYPRSNPQDPEKGIPLYLRLENNYIAEDVIQQKVDEGLIQTFTKQTSRPKLSFPGGPKVNLLAAPDGRSFQQRRKVASSTEGLQVQAGARTPAPAVPQVAQRQAPAYAPPKQVAAQRQAPASAPPKQVAAQRQAPAPAPLQQAAQRQAPAYTLQKQVRPPVAKLVPPPRRDKEFVQFGRHMAEQLQQRQGTSPAANVANAAAAPVVKPGSSACAMPAATASASKPRGSVGNFATKVETSNGHRPRPVMPKPRPVMPKPRPKPTLGTSEAASKPLLAVPKTPPETTSRQSVAAPAPQPMPKTPPEATSRPNVATSRPNVTTPTDSRSKTPRGSVGLAVKRRLPTQEAPAKRPRGSVGLVAPKKPQSRTPAAEAEQAAPDKSEQPLPSDWEEHISPEYAISFYWNRRTNESTWDRPST